MLIFIYKIDVCVIDTSLGRRLRRFLLRKRRLIAIALIIIVLLIIKIALIVHYTKADPLVEVRKSFDNCLIIFLKSIKIYHILYSEKPIKIQKCINGTCRAVEEAIGSYANFEVPVFRLKISKINFNFKLKCFQSQKPFCLSTA